MAHFMRRKILDISFQSSHAAHLGGGLSMVEVMATLYSHILNFDKDNPHWEQRDRFILSKGHGVLGYFSALLAAGFISEEKYATYLTNESDLIAHPIMNLDLGIESSNGSLGQGLAMGIGIAYSAKKNKNLNFRAFVFLGDGECNEGSIWESVLLAAEHKLDNLCCILDMNHSGDRAIKLLNLKDVAILIKFIVSPKELKPVPIKYLSAYLLSER